MANWTIKPGEHPDDMVIYISARGQWIGVKPGGVPGEVKDRLHVADSFDKLMAWYERRQKKEAQLARLKADVPVWLVTGRAVYKGSRDHTVQEARYVGHHKGTGRPRLKVDTGVLTNRELDRVVAVFRSDEKDAAQEYADLKNEEAGFRLRLQRSESDVVMPNLRYGRPLSGEVLHTTVLNTLRALGVTVEEKAK